MKLKLIGAKKYVRTNADRNAVYPIIMIAKDTAGNDMIYDVPDALGETLMKEATDKGGAMFSMVPDSTAGTITVIDESGVPSAPSDSSNDPELSDPTEGESSSSGEAVEDELEL